jgi:protein-L-isoaspartate(D-aspartate) O-methyltransferase
MTQSAAARINMVDSQIHTMGVVNDDILEAFRNVPREEFVPSAWKATAYNDEDIRLAPGRYLMEPVTHARLLQSALPTKEDNVLDIGCATGYSSAILSRLCRKIVAVEQDASLLAQAEQSWSALKCENIQPHQGPLAYGFDEGGPYDLILVNASVCTVPAPLFDQLACGGRLLAVLRVPEERIGRAMIFQKTQSGVIGERVLFDASVPYLPGFEPPKQFVF